MSTNNIKRYTVKDFWDIYRVTLEVDMDVLTEARASEINSFWTSAEDRLSECNGNAQHTAIRLFGEVMISIMLQDGGALFSYDSPATGDYWSQDVWLSEGWGGVGAGWCGIRCIAADVGIPTFDSLELKEVQA